MVGNFPHKDTLHLPIHILVCSLPAGVPGADAPERISAKHLKLFGFLLSASLAFGLVGCGGDDEVNEVDDGSDVTDVTDQSDPTDTSDASDPTDPTDTSDASDVSDPSEPRFRKLCRLLRM